MDEILTLWDIDGNLVNVYRHHTPGYQKGIEEMFGFRVPGEEIESYYGKPAKQIIRGPLRERGVSEAAIEEGTDRTLAIYAGILQENIEKARDEDDVALPGVRDLLSRLKEKKVPMGIVTGNIKIAGEAVLKGASLMEYFDPRINSYADDVNKRSEIVANAIDSARSTGLDVENDRVYVFGDTVSDIEAARENGCVSIVVVKNSNIDESSIGGEGYLSRRLELSKGEPDYLLNDYSNPDRVLGILDLE